MKFRIICLYCDRILMEVEDKNYSPDKIVGYKRECSKCYNLRKKLRGKI